MKQIFTNRLFQNILGAAGGNAVMAATSFVASIFVIRNLGPSDFGIIQEMTAYFVVIQSFESLINPNIFKKEILRQPDASEDLVIALGLLIISLSFVSSLVVSILVLLGILDQNFWLLVIMLAGILFRASNGITYYFDSRLETYKNQISINIGNAVGSSFKIFMSYVFPMALFQAVAVPLQYFLTACIHFYQYKGFQKSHLPSKQVIRIFKTIFYLSLPLFISGFVDIIKNRLPFIFLGNVTSSIDIGLYGAGVKMIEPWIFIVSALTISFWPKLVESKEKSEEHYEKIICIFFGVTFYIFTSICLGSFIFGDKIISVLMTEKFVDAIPVFKIQIISLFLLAVTQVISLIDINESRTRTVFLRNIVSLFALSLILYPSFESYGLVGVSYANAISSLIGLSFLAMFDKSSRKNIYRFIRSIFVSPRLLYGYLR
jgi:O-antigen/teichoic acid export membrane protein